MSDESTIILIIAVAAGLIALGFALAALTRDAPHPRRGGPFE